MLIQFQSTRGAGDPIWVSADHVTHVEQIGTDGRRTKIYFVGGSSVEVAAEPATVANQIGGKRPVKFG